MTTPENNPEEIQTPQVPESDIAVVAETGEGRRRLLLILQLLLLVGLVSACVLFVQYLIKPQPLPQLLPVQAVSNRCYAPTYKANIEKLNKPFGVAVSPDSQRVYVTEKEGDRMVKMFDRDGNFVTQFAAPGTAAGSHSPTYIAVNKAGQVFVVDSYSNAIDIFDKDGNYIDAIIGQDMTVTKALSMKGLALDGVVVNRYDYVNEVIFYKTKTSDANQSIKIAVPEKPWLVSGIRFDQNDDLVYTDTTAGLHTVNIIPAAALTDLEHFAPVIKQAGTFGSDPGQMNFPQTAVTDSRGNVYVTDANNSRISTWTSELKYQTFFGFGGTEGVLNLPRGAWMDSKDCLLVADTVGATVLVYDVSGQEPAYSLSFGGYGVLEGQFNYPSDVTIDGTGRLYVADSGNNRIQIWSY